MSVNNASEYLAAIEEREHFKTLLERGRKQFSGYGLELFERGLRSKIEKLNAEISRYEFEAGYVHVETNPFTALTIPLGKATRCVLQVSVVGGGQFVEPSSVANPTDWNVATPNIQMICGLVRNLSHLYLKPTPVETLPAAGGQPNQFYLERPSLSYSQA